MDICSVCASFQFGGHQFWGGRQFGGSSAFGCRGGNAVGERPSRANSTSGLSPSLCSAVISLRSHFLSRHRACVLLRVCAAACVCCCRRRIFCARVRASVQSCRQPCSRVSTLHPRSRRLLTVGHLAVWWWCGANWTGIIWLRCCAISASLPRRPLPPPRSEHELSASSNIISPSRHRGPKIKNYDVECRNPMHRDRAHRRYT